MIAWHVFVLCALAHLGAMRDVDKSPTRPANSLLHCSRIGLCSSRARLTDAICLISRSAARKELHLNISKFKGCSPVE